MLPSLRSLQAVKWPPGAWEVQIGNASWPGACFKWNEGLLGAPNQRASETLAKLSLLACTKAIRKPQHPNCLI